MSVFYAVQTAVQAILFVLEVWLLIPLKIYQSCSSNKSNSNIHKKKKTVVIVGGNFSGLAALWELRKHGHLFNIVLIDQKEYFEYTPGVLRLFCDPSLFPTMAKALPVGDGSSSMSSHRVVRGRVTGITEKGVKDDPPRKILTYDQDGVAKLLKYDYLILATGSTYADPIHPLPSNNDQTTLEDREKSWMLASNKLRSANRILILGGGAVGIELAAEIADYYPGSKQVTIVDASPKLASLFPPATGEYAHRWLTSNGVDLRLGQGVKSWNDKSCSFEDGTVLYADIVYVCFGGRPNSTMVSNSSQLDRRKNILVRDTLQIQSSSTTGEGPASCTFACGDVAAPPTEGNKQAFHAEIQGILAARNVIRKETGERLLQYPYDIAGAEQIPLVYVLSLGRYDGVLGFNNICLTGPIAALFKWILEYTKVLHMSGRLFYRLVWKVGDAAVLFLSKTVASRGP